MLPGLTDPEKSPLPELTRLEIGRLMMSVGYGTHKKRRPLSPVEVGVLVRRTCAAGATLEECAKVIKLGTSMLGRFVSVQKLPPDLLHLVDWGRRRGSIGFTAAVELVRVPDEDDQRAIARVILEEGLQTGEVRQVAQILRRSRRPVEECIAEILGMRPTIERRYVFIGTVGNEEMQAALNGLTQVERDRVLMSSIEAMGLTGASGRLGDQLFTLVGDERFNAALAEKGRKNIEARLRAEIARKIRDDSTQS